MRWLVPWLFVLAWSSVAFAEPSAGRRFALLVASHDGGPGTQTLRYAQVDVRKLRSALVDLGGFDERDIRVLREPTAEQFERAVGELRQASDQAVAAGVRTTSLVYYSGHAKDGVLLLGRTRYALADLRRSIESFSSDVKLGIIDACASGALTRAKGGKPGPSFLVSLDDVNAAKGVVLMTSSSEGEESQESDEVGGSFFTHYLASGLRGDADESGDGRVTLSELYQYAYHKTVAETVGSKSGVQHPTYLYDLSGNAQLVLADLTRGRAVLSFGEALDGHYWVIDSKRHWVAAELDKKRGQARRIALGEGSYVLKKRESEVLRTQNISLAPGQELQVDDAAMRGVELLSDHAKGLSVLAELDDPRRARLEFVPFFTLQSFLSREARDSLFPVAWLVGLGHYRTGVWGGRLGFEAALGGRASAAMMLDGLGLEVSFFEAQVSASWLTGWTSDVAAFELGPRLSGLYFRRRFPSDPDLATLTQDHFTLSPAAVVAARWTPSDALILEARGSFGVVLFSVDENQTLPFLEAGVGIGYRL